MRHGRNICELQKFIVNAIEERRENPREDLISQMVHVRIDDDENPQLRCFYICQRPPMGADSM